MRKKFLIILYCSGNFLLYTRREPLKSTPPVDPLQFTLSEPAAFYEYCSMQHLLIVLV